jgi:sec-independent protein translocase protein TatA
MGEGLLQPIHLVIIAGLALLFFGPSKLPELGKGIGDGIRNFKSGLKGATEETKTPTAPSDPE